ncbi:MAG: hypothetical protein Q8J99_20815 [Sulfuritalea sp.]|nr:hypothetical protein [Sulfuritalea sp.]
MANPSFEATIQPWGNSLGLRITRALSEVARLERGTTVTVAVVDGGLLVKRSVKARSKRPVLPYSEAELVKGLTPARAHADELPTPIASELGE